MQCKLISRYLHFDDLPIYFYFRFDVKSVFTDVCSFVYAGSQDFPSTRR
jgi:hypothetical protein